MTKKKGTSGGKILCITCKKDEKRIVRFLKNQKGFEDLSTAKQQQLEKNQKNLYILKMEKMFDLLEKYYL